MDSGQNEYVHNTLANFLEDQKHLLEIEEKHFVFSLFIYTETCITMVSHFATNIQRGLRYYSGVLFHDISTK